MKVLFYKPFVFELKLIQMKIFFIWENELKNLKKNLEFDETTDLSDST